MILFHGIGADSVYLAVLASAIASSGVASVVTPDLRCHGVSLGASDQLAIQQLELDLE
jgi:pimeloyl-ACP methyl ester carboxylesterase